MTEEEWLHSSHPAPMLSFLRNRASNRKQRLFVCACCRRVASLLNRFTRKALAVAEQYADGEVTEEKLRFASQDARRAVQSVHRQTGATAESMAMWAVASSCEVDINRVLSAVGLAARCEADPVNAPRLADAHRKQVPLLADIFGNPFRPVPMNPSWLTSTVVALAIGIYQEKAFDRMPILADALQDAGCDNEDILNHCRQPGEHVRGCFLLDLLLGKS
jgi:hypothetical protein